MARDRCPPLAARTPPAPARRTAACFCLLAFRFRFRGSFHAVRQYLAEAVMFLGRVAIILGQVEIRVRPFLLLS